jgi:hypothetical protein
LQKLYVDIVIEFIHHESFQSLPGKPTGLVEAGHALIYLVEMALGEGLDVPDIE